MNTKNDFEYKNDKYHIIGFDLSNKVDNYDFEYILGNEEDLCWGFNINNKLIGVNSCGNYNLDSNSAIVINDDFYILSDFDLYKINLLNLKCELHIDLLDYYPMDEIYKFYNGVLLIGEAEIIYVENNNIKWEYHNKDNFIRYATINNDNTIEVRIEEMTKNYDFTITLNKDGKEI